MKLTTKDSYKHTKYLPKRLRAYIDLIRPLTLCAPLTGGVLCSIMVLSYYYGFSFGLIRENLLEIVYLTATLIFLNIGSNVLNQATDCDIDCVNKPYRPIPSGFVSKDEAYCFAYFFFLIGLARAFLLNGTFGLIILTMMLISIAYSSKPICLKNRLWLNNLAQASTRGYLALIAVWVVFGSITNLTPHLYASMLFIFLVGASSLKDFADIKGDKMYNVRTLPVVYGVKRSITLITPFLFLPYVVLSGYIYLGWLSANSIYLLILTPLSVGIVYTLNKGTKCKRLENSISWVLMYAYIGLSYVLYAIIQVI